MWFQLIVSRGDYLDQKNDKSTDGLAFIILSQFKSMYLFKKKQTKKHPLQLQLFKFKTSNTVPWSLRTFQTNCSKHLTPHTTRIIWEYMKFRSKFSHLMSVSLLYSFCKSELDFSSKIKPIFYGTCIYAWGPCHFDIWMFYKEIREN